MIKVGSVYKLKVSGQLDLPFAFIEDAQKAAETFRADGFDTSIYIGTCGKCNGLGYYCYDENHMTHCDACCRHEDGYFKLSEHYDDKAGMFCCKLCGKTKEDMQ